VVPLVCTCFSCSGWFGPSGFIPPDMALFQLFRVSRIFLVCAARYAASRWHDTNLYVTDKDLVLILGLSETYVLLSIPLVALL
jgi:hypothetical protein